MNIIDQAFPINHTFTVAFTVKEEGAVGHFLHSMNTSELIHGCQVERVDVKDSAKQYNDKLDQLRDIIG
jgi:hypothetical protein